MALIGTGRAGGATVKLRADTGDFTRDLTRAEHTFTRSTGNMNNNLGKLSRGALAGSGAFHGFARSIAFASGAFLGGAGLVSVLKSSVGAASDLHEQINKATVVFRGSQREVLKWSETTATGLGIARGQALGFAATFGNLLVPMGLTRKAAADMSVGLVKLSADLASFNNASPEEVLQALQSGLAGQIRPLRQYGIFLDQTRIKAEALRLGLVKGTVDQGTASLAAEKLSIAQAKYNKALKDYGPNATQTASAHVALVNAQNAVKKAAEGVRGELTQQQKVLATHSIIMRDSRDAQNDFARTSGGLANQQRILRAQITELEEKIGKALMPTVLRLTKSLTAWLGQSKNQKTIQDDLNGVVRIAGKLFGTLRDVAQDMAPVVRILNRAVGGTKDAFKLLLALGLVLKLRGIGLALGFVGKQAAVAGGTAGVGGLLANLRLLAKIGVITVGIDILMGGHPLGKGPAGGRYSGSKGWGNLWRDLTPKSISGSDPSTSTDPKGFDRTPARGGPGKTGPITAGLKALEQAVGGHVNDDFATQGHATNSYHYRGQAADLAVDKGVWAKLYANRGMFAELFGPWGLYHYGTKFYDKKLQSQHMDHIHVAYTGGPKAISAMLAGKGGSGGGGGGGGTGAGGDSGGGTDTPLHVGTKKTSAGTKGLIPDVLQERLAKAELTPGMRDDLNALTAIEKWLDEKIKKTKNIKERVRLLKALGSVRKQIASIQEKLPMGQRPIDGWSVVSGGKRDKGIPGTGFIGAGQAAIAEAEKTRTGGAQTTLDIPGLGKVLVGTEQKPTVEAIDKSIEDLIKKGRAAVSRLKAKQKALGRLLRIRSKVGRAARKRMIARLRADIAKLKTLIADIREELGALYTTRAELVAEMASDAEAAAGESESAADGGGDAGAAADDIGGGGAAPGITDLPQAMRLGAAEASLTPDTADDVFFARAQLQLYESRLAGTTDPDQRIELIGAIASSRSALASAATAVPLNWQLEAAQARQTRSQLDDNAVTQKILDMTEARLKEAQTMEEQIALTNQLVDLKAQLGQLQSDENSQLIQFLNARREIARSYGSTVLGNALSGAQITIINQNQPTPQDPHAWSQNLVFELMALTG